MKQAILSTVIVLVSGYLRCFLDIGGCMIVTIGSATGCIVYTIMDSKKTLIYKRLN